jgi:dGTPase
MQSKIASNPETTRGRLHTEEGSKYRSPFQRDRDRVIHCKAFRRLKHKTQVFVAHEGDHFRTRLSHTIEVSQVARTIAKTLNLNSELTEVIALAHDLGHPPFAHVGEDVLKIKMKNYGGFDHNAQAIKIVTSLEKSYAEFDGLNLTWETLEGIAKHNGPVGNSIPYALNDYSNRHNLELKTHASAEAQVAAISDDIAYNNHDLDDGLRANLFTENDISNLPIVGECFSLVDAKYPNLDPVRRRNEALRRIFNEMVEDVIINSQSLIKNSSLSSSKEVRNLGYQIIQFSPRMIESINEIRTYLFDNMYRSDRVNLMRERATQVVNGLFYFFMNDRKLLPAQWSYCKSELEQAQLISDYLSGMTDGYAEQRYTELTSGT